MWKKTHYFWKHPYILHMFLMSNETNETLTNDMNHEILVDEFLDPYEHGLWQ